ncbi:pyruvate kinase [Plasticicumulans lactativorans]|uniref:Pyruvate kinase n=1 Tax=Plasticicumulans lactativorans TaxID=1133106 RepID=A0A4R2L345_9GAMM|nr:pyruvate kinase [Plasticicumulans lactativorans]TCO81561.1 pyruvate kinase [Plasticicumulans lactativorans]
MRRDRNAKIVATLGPASNDHATIRALVEAGADVFRLNFSHGDHADHKARLDTIRAVEAEVGRPVATLADLQGPKLRLGVFAEGKVVLEAGQSFRLDLDTSTPGDAVRAPMPHPEIFAALKPGAQLLIDDGRVWLEVQSCGPDFAETRVTVGGPVSNRKGVNVPSVVLPISPLTEKDRRDLAYALEIGVDWVALSFVQRPEDIDELRELIGARPQKIIAKLEKPAAIDALEAIVERTDAVMVARGDLGVEMPAEQVPAIQKRIVRACRRTGKPVIVATQMLESMVAAPVPTRAEASDVATAVYDGADAVMLSAESASGQYPVQAVAMMNNIIREVESDAYYRTVIDANRPAPEPAVADAICGAMRQAGDLLGAAATVTFTTSGSTALRAARERPATPILSLTPDANVARRLALVWGNHPVHLGNDGAFTDIERVVAEAGAVALREGFAQAGDYLVVTAGMPFGNSGTTNLLRIVRV